MPIDSNTIIGWPICDGEPSTLLMGGVREQMIFTRLNRSKSNQIENELMRFGFPRLKITTLFKAKRRI